MNNKEQQPMLEQKESEQINIPDSVLNIMSRLSDAGFEVYAVGGCVRDSFLGREPKDWDLTTNAKPEEIIEIFGEEDSFYENAFGTVGVKTGSEDVATALIEVTTYRTEGKYTDKRHPDNVEFAENIKDDLARRDFTINAMAYGRGRGARGEGKEYELVDPFDGRKDLKERRIKAVGEPRERFDEDALRLMRAVRFAAQLGFEIEDTTASALREEADGLEVVAKERIRDELGKIIMADNGDYGIELLREYGLIRHVMPELEEGWGVTQSKHHIYTVWEHNVNALKYTCEQNYSFVVRMAALLHDVGKPRVKKGDGPDSTFYGHEAVGKHMVNKMLTRLRFNKQEVDKISILVAQHMFYSDTEGKNAITDAGARRLVVRVGKENIEDLFKVREADRIGSGVPKAVPRRLQEFMAMVERAMSDPISRKMLKVDGGDIMTALDIKPSPRLGGIIDALFEEVLDDPKKNEKDALIARAKELNKLSDEELSDMRKAAQEKYKVVLGREDENMKRKIRDTYS